MVAIAGEGFVDLAILRRLCVDAGLSVERAIWGEVRTGKDGLDRSLAGWAAGARVGGGFVILRDLDGDAPCAGAMRARLLPDLPPGMVFRIAVRAADRWLLADRERLATHLSVSPDRLPRDADACPDPKAAITLAARSSRRRAVREGVPPRQASGRKQGPDYAEFMAEFASGPWDPHAASTSSDSLKRALLRFAELRAHI